MNINDGGAVRLTVDLGALRGNYRTIVGKAAPATVSAVVKADAYGLGARPIVRALWEEGCRDFFVAHMVEAVRLGPPPKDATIYILNGLQPGEEEQCAQEGFAPVLNSLAQAHRWAAAARQASRMLPAAVQVDSGMSRLGLAPEEVEQLAADGAFMSAVSVRLIMSHLACAEDPENPANADQRRRFIALAGRLPPAPLSLANSAGAFLGPDYRFDLVRPGLALYGATPSQTAVPGIRPVVSLEARVIQVRAIPAGQGVGYGLTFTSDHAMTLATIAIGYADGWPRRLSNVGFAYYGGVPLPVVGRVSMDSLTLDVSLLPPATLELGSLVELLGPHQSLEDVARAVDGIPYEILTGLGRRYPPLYRDA